MTYYKGDVVEIITATYKSWADMPPHEQQTYEHAGEPAPYVGQRFRVHRVGQGTHHPKHLLYARCVNQRGQHTLCLQTRPENVILYRRPLGNWLRELRDWLFKVELYPPA